jgi:hypothetical protein
MGGRGELKGRWGVSLWRGFNAGERGGDGLLLSDSGEGERKFNLGISIGSGPNMSGDLIGERGG